MKYFNISIDFEDLHRFNKTLGNVTPNNKDENSAFENAIPRFIDLFKKHEIHATFFITGEEVNKKPVNRRLVKRLHDAGHEIANHTYHHYFNFSDLPFTTKENEILDCHKLLEDITGDKVVGYRAPCYDIDQDTLDILRDNSYLYDSSLYRSWIRPLQQVGYCLWNLARGKKPGRWRKMGCDNLSFSLLKIPIPMCGFFQLPFYSTLVLHLGLNYFNWAYSNINERDLFTFELHSIDLIDYHKDLVAEHYKDLVSHPAMKLRNEEKLAMFNEIFTRFRKDYESVTLKEYANENIHHHSR
ncbi:MAG: polysaccharide deacetylase family protein [Candidatus Omnitrophica bacterium]|nr:polysaccharide deacetylase family protein [Candidatus Omnitrophota bacterium]